jgi:hypothetical protein
VRRNNVESQYQISFAGSRHLLPRVVNDPSR